MRVDLINSLKEWANTYENKRFIEDDPISLPHRYKNQTDIEISAFISAWLAYGNRKAIISKADFIDKTIFCGDPTGFILDFKSINDSATDKNSSLYRFYKYQDWFDMCKALHHIYANYPSMESAIEEHEKTDKKAISMPPYTTIQKFFSEVKGIPDISGGSACKRLCMFLRWMCRKDSPVDFGIWNVYKPSDLLIPLDTHVHSLSIELGLTERKSADYKTAYEITQALLEVFPNDPAKGDFALFGYDIYKNSSRSASFSAS